MMDKVTTKHLLQAAGIPTPDFFAFSQTAFRELGAADTLPDIEKRLDFPIVVKPSRQGSALGIKFARSAADVPGALVSAFSYDERVLLERHVEGRDLAVSVLDGVDGPQALPDRGGGAPRRGLLRLRGPLRDRPHHLRVPGRAAGRTRPSGPRQLALDTYGLLGCYGFARVDLMLALHGRPDGPGGQRDPRPHRHQPAAPGGRGGGCRLRRDGRADPGSGVRAGAGGARLTGVSSRKPRSPPARRCRGSP
ncbi:MAG: hypothetical protein WKF40_11360 [Thermoleophilaceae bacterium]